jgi:hypothetical protein
MRRIPVLPYILSPIEIHPAKVQIHLDWKSLLPMRRSAVVFFSILLATGCLAGRAQVVPSATAGQFSVTAGALGSIFQPDYAGERVAETSPNRLWGVGAYVDVKFTRWVQAEAEGRWLHFNPYFDITEDNYLIGPRVPIHQFHLLRATPYAKVLFGYGKMNVDGGWDRTTDIAYGGGVDLRVSRSISIRAFDFEYQQWPSWRDPTLTSTNSTLKPYGASVGIGYRIF